MVRGGQLPGQAYREVKAALEQADCPDAAFDAGCLVELVTGRPFRFDECPLTEEQAEKLRRLTAQRENRVPLQYLSQQWDFLDVTLSVGQGVLCPRADTEVLCEEAARLLQGSQQPKVLDLCAGTGCVGIGVKRLVPCAVVTCVEKSLEAYPYLEQNAARYGVTAVEGDLFGYQKLLPPGELQMITCNPPYLTAAEMEQLQPEVAHEPPMALAAGEDGLDFYRYLAKHYHAPLAPGGWLALEIGWQQGKAVTELLAREGWQEIALRQDYSGNDRVVLAKNV